MHIERIPFDTTGLIPKLVQDYLSLADNLKPFYQFQPTPDSFLAAIQRKSRENINRPLLVEVLKHQYDGIELTGPVQANINALLDTNTFTVVTAHQPVLFLGPLYCVHKAASAITTAQIAESKCPGKKVVPVFWLGAEDHDFDELGSVNVFGKKITWQTTDTGPVGRMDCGSIAPALDELESIIGDDPNSKEILALFRAAYIPGKTFAAATRFILNSLFGSFGLVVIDGDDAAMKRLFTRVMREELTNQTSFRLVTTTNAEIEKHYPIQAQPRPINLFYMRPVGVEEPSVSDTPTHTPGSDDTRRWAQRENLRERIEFDNGRYTVLNTDITFDRDAILKELDAHPERFSPNVILRGLYQESVLPNIAFVGGAAEVSYWLEFKGLFDHFNVSMPMVLLRDIFLWLDEKTTRKMESLSITTEQLFVDEDALIKQLVKERSEADLSLATEARQLQELFDIISKKAGALDPTLEQSVAGASQKALNLLATLEDKMLRAEKRNAETLLNQLRAVREHVFPGGVFQERYDSFVNVWGRIGSEMVEMVVGGGASV